MIDLGSTGIDSEKILSDLGEGYMTVELLLALKREDVSLDEVLVLLVLRNSPQLMVKQLASACEMRVAHVSRVLARLEERRYLRRVHDKKDRRRVFVRITSAGTEFLLAYAEAV